MAWDRRSYIQFISRISFGEVVVTNPCPFAFYMLYAYNLNLVCKRKLIRMLGWELHDRSL
jgi:hypothetical protein